MTIPGPILLTYPTAPKALHTVAPRTIWPAKKWNAVRDEAYRKHDYHCSCCNTPKQQTTIMRRGILEAHEIYKIDYSAACITLEDVVALCAACHAFIHAQRSAARVDAGEMREETYGAVMYKGFDLLRTAGLKPHWRTAFNWLIRTGKKEEEAWLALRRRGVLVPPAERWADDIPFGDWRLRLDGEEYHSPFADMAAWEAHHKGKERENG